MKKVVFSLLLGILLIGLISVMAQVDGQGTNQGSQSDTNAQNIDVISQQTQDQTQTRAKVQDGEHIGESGQMLKIQTQSNNRIKLEVGGVSVDCDCEMKQEKVQNKTKLSVTLSNGKNAEIKVMPDTASEKALERLKLKVCSEENGCQIELKETGSGEQTKLAYELKTQRQSKVLGLFKAKMQVQAQVNAETGEIIRTKKPWWAFLATEPAEE